jgi:hypothetical protein
MHQDLDTHYETVKNPATDKVRHTKTLINDIKNRFNMGLLQHIQLFLKKPKSPKFICIFSITVFILTIVVIYGILTFKDMILLSGLALIIWCSIMFAIILLYSLKEK